MLKPEEMIRRLRPILQDKTDGIWKSYLASDEEERKLIQHSLENLYAQKVDDYRQEKIILTPPSQFGQLSGDYPAGMVYYADRPLHPFSFLEKELVQHIGVFGRTGAGKSYFTKGLLLTHLFYKKPLWIFDWKNTYFDIAADDTLLFIPGSDSLPFFFNPLSLQGIPLEQRKAYLRQVIELFMDSYLEGLKLLTVQGVEYLLLKAVDSVAGKKNTLTFNDLYEWLKGFEGKKREMEWKSTALNLLYKLATGPLGKVMNESMSMEWLVRQKVIFGLNNCGSSDDKSFIIKTLLLRLNYHFQGQGASSKMMLFVVIEEAHNILLRKSGKESIVELLLREIREFGVGICVVDQHPSLMSLPALGTYCTVSFNLRLQQDREAMASALNLEQPELLGILPPRFAIVKIQDRFLFPFVIRAFDLNKGPMKIHPYFHTPANPDVQRRQEAGEEICRQLKAANAIPPLSPEEILPPKNPKKPTEHAIGRLQDSDGKEVFRVIREQGAMPQIPKEPDVQEQKQVIRASQVIMARDGSSPKSSPEQKNLPQSSDGNEVFRAIREKCETVNGFKAENEVFRVIRNLTSNNELLWEEAFLYHIYLQPLMPTVQRYRHLGMNEYQGNKRKGSLLDKKLIAVQDVPTSTGRVKIMMPTELAFDWLKFRGFRTDTSEKAEGIRHSYWKNRLNEQFRKIGFHVAIEESIGNRQSVDLVVSKRSRRVAVEIESTNPYEKIIGNITKCQGNGFSGIVSFVLDAGKAEKAKERLGDLEGAALVFDENSCLDAVVKFLKGRRKE